MSIEAQPGTGIIATRNGVPPEGWESDPPGGIPYPPEPVPQQGGEELPNEPPKVPPAREAQPRSRATRQSNS